TRCTTLAVGAAALVLLTAGPAQAQDCPNAESNADTGQMEAAIECLIAQDRAAYGAAPLALENHLRTAARDHAADMVARRFFSAESPSGESPEARAERFGYGGGALGLQVGTLIAFGGGPTATPRAVFNSMKSNASQLAVIRNGDLREFAAGVFRGAPSDPGTPPPATYAIYFGSRTQAIGPVAGQSMAAEVLSGNVTFALPGGGATGLVGVASVPFGGRVDTRQGRVRVAANTGAIQKIDVDGGTFTVGQTKGLAPMGELKLPKPRSCKGKRLLWTDGPGRFRTNGKYGLAVGAGARWLTQDTCAGTRITVERGSVSVRDKRTGRTRTVAAGRTLLLRPKRR
ncbi:MAG TPA: CAP domain-containing protein, partial [Solirubrobacteraceae bacterium]